ncbi:Glutamyl-tRNA(Gln) amidotransferase subunit C [Oligella ureolytica]|uniref:Aspartyl/glutamyl-tRNA(Asn/Gln) amidotransferase subunit C n=1 Tax=Oligella ureolytica TaxID=90244 RepID=A0A378XGP8_9BURK|nr:Asp-tRNA(Asn)/Glu-tRNA(Gln) amidotransferase subunit GatC [Oligella ureolytica]NLP32342.1 Asp-tRNA(Asn)/Glu-tRNA(Gln) amidotransferase subunit GatC [Oligella ureolytica]QPT39413.1 Asp-tRNA(Asn)/Glu-tRNA(Gln) amidotransferase subunit GatC [Oligella ureolytica]SUA56069.1 Glutamyl-tRNA(Gln) amidotransferase subunit C [Oligella ureolytica]SUA57399.1 Glutamyl-tRNA(Gln) amidotransferase subunit C [Oligella ureolytica]
MSLSNQDIKRIANLAAIKISDEESSQYEAEINSLLTIFNSLKSIDTEGVEPLTHPLAMLEEVQLRLRDDVVTETDTPEHRDQLMSNAPASTEGVFLVPKVIE